MATIPEYVFDPARLAALADFEILDTAPEPGFDDIVNLAMLICQTPVSLVSLVAEDRQWFKARAGFEPCETDLQSSVCAHALIDDDLLIIPDLTLDPRTKENPLVVREPHIRFYAGAPLRSTSGHVIGSLCVIDDKPRSAGLTALQSEGLRMLARQVMAQLELRRALAQRSTFLEEQIKAEARRAGLLSIGDKLRDASTIEEMTTYAGEVVGRTLGADRAGFGVLSDDGMFVDVAADWTAPNVTSARGRHQFADYGDLSTDLLAGRPLIISDVMTDRRTSARPAALLRLGIRSLLNIVVLDHGRPVALFFVHSSKPIEWPPEVVTFVRNVAERVEIGAARLSADEKQRILNHELSHRMKNTMAMVQAIATQTLKDAADKEAVDAFTSRVHALASAHDVLLQRSWLSADLEEVVRNVTSSLQKADRFKISGPRFTIGPRATLSLSLLLHELTTNAVKYGALAHEEGIVEIDWLVDGDPPELVLRWKEQGGPPVIPPSRRGFGSRLIRMGLVGTGGVQIDYPQAGLVGEFRAPLLEVQRS